MFSGMQDGEGQSGIKAIASTYKTTVHYCWAAQSTHSRPFRDNRLKFADAHGCSQGSAVQVSMCSMVDSGCL